MDKFCLFFLTFCSFAFAELREFSSSELIKATPRAPSKTAVLIIAPYSDEVTSCLHAKWQLGKKMWEQYMRSTPGVDCFFLKYCSANNFSEKESIWFEDANTIVVGNRDGKEHEYILYKTIRAFEFLLPQYTHFVRTNLNTFINLKLLKEYNDTHSDSYYSGPFWQNKYYVTGYGIFCTKDVAAHIANEYRRIDKLENKNSYLRGRTDDGALCSLATGVIKKGRNSVKNEYCCCKTLTSGVRQLFSLDSFDSPRHSQYGVRLFPNRPPFQEAMQDLSSAVDHAILFRLKGSYSLEEYGHFYQFLLDNVYQELPRFDAVDFANKLF